MARARADLPRDAIAHQVEASQRGAVLLGRRAQHAHAVAGAHRSAEKGGGAFKVVGEPGKRHTVYTETDRAGRHLRRRRVAEDQHVRDAEVDEPLNFVCVGVAHVAAGRELRHPR